MTQSEGKTSDGTACTTVLVTRTTEALVQYRTGPTLALSTVAKETQTGDCTVQMLRLTHTDISGTHIAQNEWVKAPFY